MSKEAFKQIVAADSPDIQQAVTSHAQNDMANIQGAGQEQVKGLFAQVAGAVVDTVGAAYDLAQKPTMQGAAELAQALFSPNGNAYVPYGEGQRSNDVPQHGLPEAAKQQEMERGGMER